MGRLMCVARGANARRSMTPFLGDGYRYREMVRYSDNYKQTAFLIGLTLIEN